VYVDSANSYTPGLVAQIEYLIGNVNAPNVNSAEWRTFTLVAAQSVQGLAGAAAGTPAPGSVATPHAGLAAAVNQASSAAGAVIAAVNANDAGADQATAGALSSARSAIDSAVGSVSAAVGAC
jgi:hypothetical protein